jgi:3-oxoacyl-[acyl-carrier protein] reductase
MTVTFDFAGRTVVVSGAAMPPDKLEQVEASIPMGRIASADEICSSVGFLASEEAGYITGAVLPVDGGLAI